MTGPLPFNPAIDPHWRAERLTEARAIIADIAHHSDSLARMACRILIQHGQSGEEREEARLLLVILDARQPARNGGSRDEP